MFLFPSGSWISTENSKISQQKLSLTSKKITKVKNDSENQLPEAMNQKDSSIVCECGRGMTLLGA